MADERSSEGEGQMGIVDPIIAPQLTRRLCETARVLFLLGSFAFVLATTATNSVASDPTVPVGAVPFKWYAPSGGQQGSFAGPVSFKGTGVGQVDYRIAAIQPDSSIGSSSSGPRKTGVVYTLPTPITASMLKWERASNGFAARVKIIADQAQSLRVHLSLGESSPIVEIRVQGNRDTSLLGPITGSSGEDREIWLPVTAGEEVILEVFIPNQEAVPNVGLQIDRINYIFGGAVQSGQFASTGAAQFLEFDATCFSSSPDYAALQAGVAATAKITYISNGASYICTGTLLNDRGSTSTPWFATANHCIPNQPVASTIAFFWRYEATSCGGSTLDSRYSQTSGGAQLLWSDVTYDTAFLKLNKPPGLYTAFAGWDAGSLSIGGRVYGIHHPSGDHTMVSVGAVTELDAPIKSINTGVTLTLNKIAYSSGGTEGGSSGSGLFSIQNNVAYWRGGLFGGPTGDYQASSYGPFDNFYNNVKQYLENTASQAVTDAQAPTVPVGLTATAVSSSQVNLNWAASTDNVAVTS